jgi:hypothetical protein
MTIEEHLVQIKEMLGSLVTQQALREWYSIEEFAKVVGKAEFTCREWARLGRIRGEKKQSGRGPHAHWAIAHSELLRYQREGLLPRP